MCYPLLLAWAAGKHAVGFEICDNKIIITIDKMVVDNPRKLLKLLSNRADNRLLQDVQDRLSTNLAKDRSPRFGVNWGLEGLVNPNRKEAWAYLSPNSRFNDDEIRAILAARLFAWHTMVVANVRDKTGHLCHCGAKQTITHLLNIPLENTQHSIGLRELGQKRHKVIVDIVVKHLTSGTDWIRVDVNDTDASGYMKQVCRKVKAAVLNGDLRVPGQDRQDGTPAQHHKPDIVLVRRAKTGEYEFIIIDVTYGSDDKLIIEEEYTRRKRFGSHDELVKHMTSELFDGQGKPRSEVLAEIPHEDDTRARNIQRFKQSHYYKRYTPLTRTIEQALTGENPKVQMRTIALGVIGWIPKFSRNNIKEILSSCNISENNCGFKQKALLEAMVSATYDFVAKGRKLWIKEKL